MVISFGKKVFRTRVIRHQLNPVWDEKLLFHVRRNENAYTIQFAVLDWDKVGHVSEVGDVWSLIDCRSPGTTWSARVLCLWLI